jgi:hypothetical protein
LVFLAYLSAVTVAGGASVGVRALAVVGLSAFLLSFLAVSLMDGSDVRRQIADCEVQTLALIQVRPLLGPLPIPLGAWAADPLLAYHAVQLVMERRPGLVIECGSGSSTVIVARCLQELGHGRILSLEHDPDFAEQTRSLLREHGVADLATVVTAPLTRRQHEGREYRWYDSLYETYLTEPAGVLLVDGPPGSTAPHARFPAFPLLRRFLSEDWAILMDDGDRPDERWIARTWAEQSGATLRHLRGGRGGWVLRSKPTS